MVVISYIIWPLEDIHTEEIALIFGLCYIFGSFSRITTGILADRYSRIKLIGFTGIGSSFFFLMYGFMPEGLGTFTLNYIILITILRELFTGTGTIIPSYLDDSVEEGKRSEILGALTILVQLMVILSNLICAIFFKYVWRQFFILVGLSGILIGIAILIKGKEPKRGSKREELKILLSLEEKDYNYNLNRETIRSTIFSKSNLIILFEGMFTQIVLVVPQILLIGYLQSPPYNFSPIIFAFLGILFGGPGAILGSVILSKRIDKTAERNIKNRIYIIFSSLIISYLIWIIVIFIPYKQMTPTEGENFILFISNLIHILAGIFYFFGFFLSSVFVITQGPLIQKINLPEAQGAITSLNNFFEILCIGIGAILAAIILNLFDSNYQVTVLILMIIGSLGAMLWLFGLKFIDNDKNRISKILELRKAEIETNSKI